MKGTDHGFDNVDVMIGAKFEKWFFLKTIWNLGKFKEFKLFSLTQANCIQYTFGMESTCW